MAKKLTDKLLTIYENIWCIGGGIVLLFFVSIFFFFLVKSRELQYYTLIILIGLGIIFFLGARRWNKINKKIGLYEKVAKEEYDWWARHRKGFFSPMPYEEYMKLCDLPSDERDPYKDADFSEVFKEMEKRK